MLSVISPGGRPMRLIDRLREAQEIRSESLRQRVQFASDRVFGFGRTLVQSAKIPKPKRPALDRETWRD